MNNGIIITVATCSGTLLGAMVWLGIQIGSLQTSVVDLCDQLDRHEVRILRLENHGNRS